MAMFNLFGMYSLADKIHDCTVPEMKADKDLLVSTEMRQDTLDSFYDKEIEEECPKGCPLCNGPQCEEQPYPGTHAYSINYQCGYSETYIIGEDEPSEIVEPSHCTKAQWYYRY